MREPRDSHQGQEGASMVGDTAADVNADVVLNVHLAKYGKSMGLHGVHESMGLLGV